MSSIATLKNEILDKMGFNENLTRPLILNMDWSQLDRIPDQPEDEATRNKIFAQNAAPTENYKEGDLWFDTDNDNTIYRANNLLVWVSVKDGTILVGATTTFAQDAIPTSLAIGDLWLDTNDKNKLYRAASAGADQITAGEWIEVRDTDIAQAISDASNAQATADGKIVTFYQSGVPTATDAGDLWVDTDDGKLYRATAEGDDQIGGGEWVRIDTGLYPGLIDVLNTTNAPAVAGATDDTAANAAQGTANIRITTFIQSAIPTALAAGDLWIDTDDGKAYRATSVGDDVIGGGEWIRFDIGLYPGLIDVLNTANAPAEAGADVTADNQAATIASQGALATKNTADFSTEVAGATKPANNATVGATFGSNVAGGGSGNTQVSNAGYATLYRQTIFGNGADGALTYNGGGTSTLTADIYATSITISNNTTLATGGYRIFCSGTLSIESGSKITGNGNAGSVGGDPVTSTGGIGGAGGTKTSGFIENVAGSVGGAGASGANNGNPGIIGTSETDCVGGNGSAGGAGGDAPSTYTGGAGGGAGTATAANSQLKNVTEAILMRNYIIASSNLLNTAAGSGGGGGGGCNGGSNAGAGGGGGGATGLIVLICAKTITNAGTIEAKGGKGGNGADVNNSNFEASGGGGGGGHGGVLILIYQTATVATTDVGGGAGGLAGTYGSPVAGTVGSAGSKVELNI